MIVTGGAAYEVDGAIVFPGVMDVAGENGGEVALLGKVDEIEAVGEAGEMPGPAVVVEPYIIV